MEGGGKREIVYLSLHCYHHETKMGSVESHFNVSLIVRDKVTGQLVSTNHDPFEEKREPKRNRAEALLLTSLTP